MCPNQATHRRVGVHWFVRRAPTGPNNMSLARHDQWSLINRVFRKKHYFLVNKKRVNLRCHYVWIAQISIFRFLSWKGQALFLYSKDIQEGNSQNPALAITFEWSVIVWQSYGPRSTFLSCIFNALYRDTPLGYVRYTLPNSQIAKYLIFGHIWLFGKVRRTRPSGVSLKRALKMQLRGIDLRSEGHSSQMARNGFSEFCPL